MPPGPDPGQPDDDPADDDPFASLTLDDAFVQAAPINELPAEERERMARQRAEREADLRRRLAERGGEPRSDVEGLHRLAPGGWDRDDPEAWEADDWGSDDWDSDDWDGEAERPPRRRSRLVQLLALVVVAAIVIVYVASHLVGIWASDLRSEGATVIPSTELDSTDGAGAGAGAGAAGPGDPTVEFIRPADWPSPQGDPSPTPLGTPAPVPGTGGPHAFLAMQPDGVSPVAYDPCRPIHYVTRPGGPPEGDALIREALATVSTATGLRFVDDGTTDEAPSDDRAAYQPDVYGDRWAPVLFAWSDAVESPRLGEIDPDDPQADPAGYAGSTMVGLEPAGGEPTGATLVFVSGSVTLDGPDLGRIAEGPDGRAIVRSIIQHEVAHLVGLAHVEDRGQLMHPVTQPGVTGFAAGDLEGLAALGRGACFPQI